MPVVVDVAMSYFQALRVDAIGRKTEEVGVHSASLGSSSEQFQYANVLYAAAKTDGTSSVLLVESR